MGFDARGTRGSSRKRRSRVGALLWLPRADRALLGRAARPTGRQRLSASPIALARSVVRSPRRLPVAL
jgi:hypothetical protein